MLSTVYFVLPRLLFVCSTLRRPASVQTAVGLSAARTQTRAQSVRCLWGITGMCLCHVLPAPVGNTSRLLYRWLYVVNDPSCTLVWRLLHLSSSAPHSSLNLLRISGQLCAHDAGLRRGPAPVGQLLQKLQWKLLLHFLHPGQPAHPTHGLGSESPPMGVPKPGLVQCACWRSSADGPLFSAR